MKLISSFVAAIVFVHMNCAAQGLKEVYIKKPENVQNLEGKWQLEMIVIPGEQISIMEVKYHYEFFRTGNYIYYVGSIPKESGKWLVKDSSLLFYERKMPKLGQSPFMLTDSQGYKLYSPDVFITTSSANGKMVTKHFKKIKS